MIADAPLLLAYLVTVTALVAAPGPDFLLVAANSASRGWLHGSVAAVGVSIGLLLHTLLGVVGLSSLIYSSAVAFSAVKFLGVCYLIFLGVRMAMGRSRAASTPNTPRPTSGSKRATFRTAVLTNVLNPKVSLVCMAVLPQFVAAFHGPYTLRFGLLGVLQASLALVLFLGLATACSAVATQWRNRLSTRIHDALQTGIGLFFIGFGLRLAAFDRR